MTAPTLDRALEVFAAVKLQVEAEHGPLPGPRSPRRHGVSCDQARGSRARIGLVHFFTSLSGKKKVASSA